ncbi:MAG: OmpA family protein, partial [Novosphingobium sp.]|nr:OmpA family protein [Novosphingobium sp.]
MLRGQAGAAIAGEVNPLRLAIILAGAAASAGLAFASTLIIGADFIAGLEQRARVARDAAGGRGIEIDFTTPQGWLTRHPVLSGGEGLDDATRARTAMAIAALPGIGGGSWKGERARSGLGAGPVREVRSGHCQNDVEAILRVRTIRFDEASARLDRASLKVLDEVAAALLPCVGSIIAITGHTDANGDPAANLALSHARANAVRWALIGRGIPADGLRAIGAGSQRPIEGLDPADPANRRIEFSVIEPM